MYSTGLVTQLSATIPSYKQSKAGSHMVRFRMRSVIVLHLDAHEVGAALTNASKSANRMSARVIMMVRMLQVGVSMVPPS